MIVDVKDHAQLVTRAALEQMLRFQQDRSTIDNCHPTREFNNVMLGKLGEVAWALVLGYTPEIVLDDDGGRPDFTTVGFKVDVKTAPVSASAITVRAYYLDKPDLNKWQILAARADINGFTVELLGSMPGEALAHYPITGAARGHSKGYMKVPVDDFDQSIINKFKINDRETA